MDTKLIDHLFRHQYGKMVSVLTRIYGLSHLETIEDAVQDTFATATVKWRTKIPDSPEAWLMQAAKNRAIDLLRKLKADFKRYEQLDSGPSAMAIEHLFMEEEIEDSQLRMIFTACHPALDPKDQIAFALKTIAGFSMKEIASALLLKNETIKKRLTRARQTIKQQQIDFNLPDNVNLKARLSNVFEVLYLIFNEGFHSNHQQMLIRKDLCGEAIRLMRMVLKKESLRTGTGYALLALMCFHSARLESKTSKDQPIIDLKSQDRSLWYKPLYKLGTDLMIKAYDYPEYSSYHIEALIASEHLKACSFEATNWERILILYRDLDQLHSTPLVRLNIAFVLLQLKQYDEARKLLIAIKPAALEQRRYLYYGTMAEYFRETGNLKLAIENIDKALEAVSNFAEKQYMQRKKADLEEMDSVAGG